MGQKNSSHQKNSSQQQSRTANTHDISDITPESQAERDNARKKVNTAEIDNETKTVSQEEREQAEKD